jgi:serine/threonine-protein kinase RsbW
MHYYDQKIRRTDGPFDLKLEAGARCVECRAFTDMHPVFHRIEDLMGVLGYPVEDIVAVAMALREAAVNAARHGNGHDTSKRIYVRYLITQDDAVVEVEDEGPGFDPTDLPTPFVAGGTDRFKRMGLFLMCAYMDWVQFNTQGNRVTLGRRRSAP